MANRHLKSSLILAILLLAVGIVGSITIFATDSEAYSTVAALAASLVGLALSMFIQRRFRRLAPKVALLDGALPNSQHLQALLELDREATNDKSIRQQAVDILCTFLRMSRPAPYGDTSSPDAQALAQEILLRHLRNREDDSAFWPGMDVNLSGAVLSDFNFSYCEARRVTFERATFRGQYTEFRRARISGYAIFSRAEVTGSAHFDECVFQQDAAFDEVAFRQEASFNETVFNADAVFVASLFTGGVYFAAALFSRDATFSLATFMGTVIFKHSTFRGNVTFRQANFHTGAEFSACRFDSGFYLDDARLETVSFNSSIFFGSVSLAGANIRGAISFENAELAGEHATPGSIASASQRTLERGVQAATRPGMSATARLAELLAEQGRTNEAEELFRRAANAGDQSATARLAELLAEQGRTNEAEEFLRRAANAGDQSAAPLLKTLLSDQNKDPD